MANGGLASAFVQKESLARKFLVSTLLTSLLFLVSSAGVFFSSQTTLNGLNDLHKTYELQNYVRQIHQMVSTFGEVVRRWNGDSSRALALLRISREQINQIFKQSSEIDTGRQTVRQEITAARARAEEFLDAAETMLQNPNREDSKLIVEQLETEITDMLTQMQINTKAHSDDTFAKIYADRFKPLIAGVVLGLIFMGFSLYLGLTIRRRMTSAIGNLLNATKSISEGDLNYRAKIMHADEIGNLTDAFNKMTDSMQESTVSKEYVESIIESMLDSVIVVDNSGKILHLNENTTKVFGYEKNELLGQHYCQLVGTSIPLVRGVFDDDIFGNSKNGSKVPVEVSFSTLEKGDARGIRGFVMVLRDITDRKRIEKELKAKNVALTTANKEIEAFSYSVSHDLRAPLRGIDGFSQALIEDLGPKLADEEKNYLQRIRAGVQRMGHLIDDMLGLSKLSRREMVIQNVSITTLSEEVIAELRESQPERSVQITVAPGMVVEADPSLLKALLQNLIGNAWKYTSKTEHAKIEIGFTEKDGKRVFHVKDNGAGFDMAYYDRLFGAFQRLHRDQEFPGTGVGLATVQRIIHRHGGTISGHGEVGKGAEFYFTFET